MYRSLSKLRDLSAPPPTPHEQNVPGRAQPFRKTLMCFDSSAEKRSCGFQQCSPKITEKTNTNGGLIAASQRALADVFMCCRDNFEQESSARSGMSLSPCRRRKTERCSHVSHSSAHWELAAGCRYRSPQRSYRVFSVISRSTNLQLHLFFSSFHFRSCVWTSRPTTQYNGVTRINGDWVRFCKTKEKLKFLYVAILGFSFLFLSSQCCGYVQALGWGSENIVVLQKTKPP